MSNSKGPITDWSYDQCSTIIKYISSGNVDVSPQTAQKMLIRNLRLYNLIKKDNASANPNNYQTLLLANIKDWKFNGNTPLHEFDVKHYLYFCLLIFINIISIKKYRPN